MYALFLTDRENRTHLIISDTEPRLYDSANEMYDKLGGVIQKSVEIVSVSMALVDVRRTD